MYPIKLDRDNGFLLSGFYFIGYNILYYFDLYIPWNFVFVYFGYRVTMKRKV